MKKNMGTVDRALRAVAGLALIGLYLSGAVKDTAWLHYGASTIAVVLLATAALGICPPYAIFGISTCKKAS